MGGSCISDHIPQTVAEMYGTAIFLDKNIIRGALSNGREWIFIILYRDEDSGGGRYRHSTPIQLEHPGEGYAHRPDVITGILTYWAEHSFEDLDNFDWFK